MKLPIGLLATAIVLFASGVAAQAEEAIVVALLAAGGSVITYAIDLRSRLLRLEGVHRPAVGSASVEQRLSLLERELETATIELERLRVEREFDRQLLGRP